MPQTGYETHGGWTTLEEELTFLSALASEHGHVDVSLMGYSFGGVETYLARMSYPTPQGSESKPAILLLNGVHGLIEAGNREGCFLVFRDMAESDDPDVIQFLTDHVILFIPSFNGDGIKNGTYENVANVNLNRKWWLLDMPENRMVAPLFRDYDIIWASDGHGHNGSGVNRPELEIGVPTNRNVDQAVRDATITMVEDVIFPGVQAHGYTTGYFPSGLHNAQDAKNAWGLRHVPNILIETDRTTSVQHQTELNYALYTVILSHLVDNASTFYNAKREAESRAAAETESLYLPDSRWDNPATWNTVSPTPKAYKLTASQRSTVDYHFDVLGISGTFGGVNLNQKSRQAIFLLVDPQAHEPQVSASRSATQLSDSPPDGSVVLRPEPESLVLYPEGHLDGTPQPDDAPPVFQTSPPTSVRAGQVYVYNGVVTDADGDPITVTLEEGPDWLTLTDHGDGTFTLEGTAPNE